MVYLSLLCVGSSRMNGLYSWFILLNDFKLGKKRTCVVIRVGIEVCLHATLRLFIPNEGSISGQVCFHTCHMVLKLQNAMFTLCKKGLTFLPLLITHTQQVHSLLITRAIRRLS